MYTLIKTGMILNQWYYIIIYFKILYKYWLIEYKSKLLNSVQSTKIYYIFCNCMISKLGRFYEYLSCDNVKTIAVRMRSKCSTYSYYHRHKFNN